MCMRHERLAIASCRTVCFNWGSRGTFQAPFHPHCKLQENTSKGRHTVHREKMAASGLKPAEACILPPSPRNLATSVFLSARMLLRNLSW